MGGNKETGGATRLRHHRVATAVVALTPWVAVTYPATAGPETSAAVGACVITVHITADYGLIPSSPPTTPTSLAIGGQGTCVVNGDLGVAANLSGTAKTVGDTSTWTCAGGVARGVLTFSVTHEDFPSGATAELAISVEGGVMTFVAADVDDDGDPTFTGAGELVQDTNSLTACPTEDASSKTTTWSGPFDFTYTSSGALPPPISF